MKRQYYIDNLRWICIILLLPFHAAMTWNTWEGNYIWISESKVLSSVVIMISPYYMPLLFVLAGISMKFALKKRSNAEFLLERIKKLLLPLISGTLTVVAVMTYYADRFHNGYTGNLLQHYTVFLGEVGDFTGYDGKLTVGHLWFMLFLFVVSLLVLLVVVLQRRFLPKISFEKWRMWQVFLLVIFPILFSFIIDNDGKSIGESFAFVVLGYYVFSEKEIIEKLSRLYIPYLAVTLVSCCIYTVVFIWLGEHDTVVCDVANEVAKWCGILGLLGFGKKHLDITNKLTRFMTVRSFPIYIFHFGWVLVLQYYLHRVTSNASVVYIGSILGALVLTLCTVEIVRQIPVVRYLFGMGNRKHIKKRNL